MEWITHALALLAALAGAVAAVWWRIHATAQAPLAPHVPEEGAVRAQARIAAACHVRGRPAANPHPLGSSARALWDAQFQHTLGDFRRELSGAASSTASR